jgi:CRISPR/Cas system CMR-associated protein Cmr3 (group 5 of RAMP superfamily)
MLEDGPGSGVDLVKRMQLGGDLENAWLMFDHVKRIKEWTTMACHVYNAAYYKVMTIAVCDMQLEDMKVQCIMWRELNNLMAKNGVKKYQLQRLHGRQCTSQLECCPNRLWKW